MSSYWLFILGALFSLAGTLGGLGGGAFLLPVLVLVFHTPIEVAVGVSALSIFPAAVYSSVINFHRGLIDFRLLLWIEVPAMVGAALGALATQWIPQRPLVILFVVLLIFMSLRTYFPPKRSTVFSRAIAWLNELRPNVANAETYRLGLWGALFFGGSAGLTAGLLGIGGGIIKTPVLMNSLKIPPKRATATVLAMIAVTTLVAGVTHLKLGHIDFDLLTYSAPGLFTGAIMAQLIVARISEQTVRRVVAIVMLFAALALLFKV